MRYILSEKENYKFLINFAKENRKSPTFAERIVWNELRRNSFGVRFKRQVVVGMYIVDFICIEKKLIIEIEGYSHDGKEEYDKNREEYLKVAGFRVLRFTNDDATNNWEKCTTEIRKHLIDSTVPTSPRPSPKEREKEETL